MWSALMGSLHFLFFDRDLFALLSTYFIIPKSTRAYLSPQSVKRHYFSGSPIRVDPISPQPMHALITIYIYIYI